jgi:hypothetical protein
LHHDLFRFFRIVLAAVQREQRRHV